jgi:hypothetical protein
MQCAAIACGDRAYRGEKALVFSVFSVLCHCRPQSCIISTAGSFCRSFASALATRTEQTLFFQLFGSFFALFGAFLGVFALFGAAEAMLPSGLKNLIEGSRGEILPEVHNSMTKGPTEFTPKYILQ